MPDGGIWHLAGARDGLTDSISASHRFPPPPERTLVVAYQPYPRGFLLTRQGHQSWMPEEWASIPLPCDNWQFSHDHYYHPDLSVNDAGSRWVLVHGLCLYAGSDALTGSIADHLLAQWEQHDGDFLSALDDLGGRHLILRGTKEHMEVYNDAQGLRTVYSSQEVQAVGSHAHLINALHPHSIREEREGARALTHSWDRTRYHGIEPLLPNHCLRLPSWEVNRFFPRTRNLYRDWSLDAKLDQFQRMWSMQMKQLVALDTTLVMSITGGADSRTSLALSTRYVDDIEFFTYTAKRVPGSKWNDSLALDRDLVEQIKELVPLKHRYFESEKRDNELIEKLAPILDANTTQHHSRWLVAFYAAAFPEEGYTHIRGNGYEVGRAYWGAREDNDTMASLKNLYMQITKGDHGCVPADDRRSYFEQGVKKWEYDGERHGYHIRDIAYWELRSGRWLAEVLNETDLAFETFVPLNVRALLDITLSMNVQERQDALIFSELINRAKPILNFPGKNDIRNLYERTRDNRLDAEGRNTTADSAKLHSTLSVTDQDGVTTELPANENELSLPADKFLRGARAVRTFAPVNSRMPHTLTFTVDAPYRQALAVNRFEYEILLDGQTVAAWDGATISRPVHVTVDDLSNQATIAVAVSARSDQQGKASWEEASRARIRHIHYSQGHFSRDHRPPSVWTDAPAHHPSRVSGDSGGF